MRINNCNLKLSNELIDSREKFYEFNSSSAKFQKYKKIEMQFYYKLLAAKCLYKMKLIEKIYHLIISLDEAFFIILLNTLYSQHFRCKTLV